VKNLVFSILFLVCISLAGCKGQSGPDISIDGSSITIDSGKYILHGMIESHFRQEYVANRFRRPVGHNSFSETLMFMRSLAEQHEFDESIRNNTKCGFQAYKGQAANLIPTSSELRRSIAKLSASPRRLKHISVSGRLVRPVSLSYRGNPVTSFRYVDQIFLVDSVEDMGSWSTP